MEEVFDKNQPHKRLPVFKKAGRNEAGIRYPQGFALEENNRVMKLPKLGWIKYHRSRTIEGAIKNITLGRQDGCYMFSIQTEREVAQPVHPATSAVDIDLGVRQFAGPSNGEFITGPKPL